MKKRFFFLFASFLVVSCIETLSVIPFNSKREVAVFCVLNESPVQYLKLYYIGENGLPGNQPVEGARAWLCSQDTTIAFERDHGIDWSCNYQPFFGERIELKVIPPGQDTLRSVTVFPKDFEVVARKNDYLINNEADSTDTHRGIMSYELYESNKYSKDTYYIKPIDWNCFLWFVPCDNKGYPTGEYIASNHTGADDFNVVPKSITDLPCFNPNEIETKFLKYKSMLRCASECFPNIKLHYKVLRINHPANYSHPPKKEEDNYYEAYSRNSYILLSESYYQRFLPQVFDDKNYRYMYVYSVSNEYDAYLKKTYERILDSGNLISSLYDTDASFSNIHGGRGVFGACIVRIVPSIPCLNTKPEYTYYPFTVTNY